MVGHPHGHVVPARDAARQQRTRDVVRFRIDVVETQPPVGVRERFTPPVTRDGVAQRLADRLFRRGRPLGGLQKKSRASKLCGIDLYFAATSMSGWTCAGSSASAIVVRCILPATSGSRPVFATSSGSVSAACALV